MKKNTSVASDEKANSVITTDDDDDDLDDDSMGHNRKPCVTFHVRIANLLVMGS